MSGFNGSCGVTGGISGFSTLFKDSAPLFCCDLDYGRAMLMFWPNPRSALLLMVEAFGDCWRGFSSP